MVNQTDLSAWLGCDTKAAFNMFASKERLQSWLPVGVSVKSTENGRFKITWTIHLMDDTKTTIHGRILAYEPNKYLAFEFSSPASKSLLNSSQFSSQMVIYFLPMPSEKSGRARFTEVHMVLSGWCDFIHGEFLKSWFETTWARAFEKLIQRVNDTKRKRRLRRVTKRSQARNN